MQKILIYISVLLYSCSYHNESIGSYNEVLILTSEEDRPNLKLIFDNLFSHTIYTPQSELEFKLKYIDAWEIDKYKNYGNIILGSLTFPKDSTGDLLTKRFIEKQNQNDSLFIINDLYAKNQIIGVLHSHDIIKFQDIIIDKENWILNHFRSNIYNKIQLDMYKYGKNIEINKMVEKIFNCNIDMQTDFKIIKYNLESSFLWLGRGMPYRWLILHKINSNDLNIYNSNIWIYLTKLFASTLPEISISNYYRYKDQVTYGNSNRKLLRGVYDHSESATGGPFFTYIYEINKSKEVILITGFVNYPGHEKLNLLKQLEIIAFSIKERS